MAKHDDGSGVVSYDSFEEMMEDQQRAHDAAMENMTESQRAIPVGGYACNISHLRDFGPIFGAIQSVAEVRAWHELYYGVGDASAARAALARRGIFTPPHHPADPSARAWREDGYPSGEEAIQGAIDQHLSSYANGYLFGWWLSNLEPGGELGSAHASVCVEITEEAFRDAQAHGGYVSTATAVEISRSMRIVRGEYQARESREQERGEGDEPER